jgi:hypothetical protein
MKRKRGNPNWFKPPVHLAAVPNSFDQVVSSLKLSPAQYSTSPALKEWVLKHKNSRYVPAHLLELWGLTVARFKSE